MTRANLKKSRSNPPAIIFLILALFCTLLLLIVVFTSEAEANNNNVKTGEVKVSTGLYKLCDGKNLVYTYVGRNIAVSPNDSQCN